MPVLVDSSLWVHQLRKSGDAGKRVFVLFGDRRGFGYTEKLDVVAMRALHDHERTRAGRETTMLAAVTHASGGGNAPPTSSLDT